MSTAFDGAWATSSSAMIPPSMSATTSTPKVSYEPPPAPTLNAGLYTGMPFAPGAPWGNVPVVPDAGYMTSVNLLSANPPPGAISQFAETSFRVGNNTPATLPQGVLRAVPHMCQTVCTEPIPYVQRTVPSACPADAEVFTRFARWTPS